MASIFDTAMMNTTANLICKAKRKDTGEWVEGYVVDFTLPNGTPNIEMFPLCEDGSVKSYAVSVIQDTVCRWTGLFDRNKNRIYEGDTIRHYNSPDDPDCFTLGTVFWNENKCKFMRTRSGSDEPCELWKQYEANYQIEERV